MSALEWHDDAPGGGRWYCAGKPVHAGCVLELAPKQASDIDPDHFETFRIESTHGGTRLYACRRVHGMMMRTESTIAYAVAGEVAVRVFARWPDGGAA